MSGSPTVNRSEAAALCGVSKDTIRRRQRAGRFPNAEETDAGWMIPVADLVEAKLLDPWDLDGGAEAAASAAPDLQQRVAELTQLLERERSEVEFLRTALRDALRRAA
jgi:hypothetical protein